MSISRVNYVGGDAKKRAYKPDPVFPFNKGDLLFKALTAATLSGGATAVVGSVYPASAIEANATAEECQLAFAMGFVGVADERYYGNGQPGEATFNVAMAEAQKSVSVCTGGLFEFDCPAKAWKGNDPVGIYATGSVSTFTITDSQTVDTLYGTTMKLDAVIGTVAQQEAPIEQGQASQTRVVVEINPPKPAGTAPVSGSYAHSYQETEYPSSTIPH